MSGNRNRRPEKESYWREVLERFGISGLSVRAFCRQSGVSEASFYFWRKEIARREAGNLELVQPAMVPVNIVDSNSDSDLGNSERNVSATDGACFDRLTPTPLLEVSTPSGFTLRFHHVVEPDRFGSLLSVVSRFSGRAGDDGAKSC